MRPRGEAGKDYWNDQGFKSDVRHSDLQIKPDKSFAFRPYNSEEGFTGTTFPVGLPEEEWFETALQVNLDKGEVSWVMRPYALRVNLDKGEVSWVMRPYDADVILQVVEGPYNPNNPVDDETINPDMKLTSWLDSIQFGMNFSTPPESGPDFEERLKNLLITWGPNE